VTGAAVTIFTVGHSSREADAFRELLEGQGIRRLVDVRRFPVSRRHPQFAAEALSASLAAAGISYRHEPALGGRREPRPDSPNTAWRDPALRGYADHMRSPEFHQALSALVAEAAQAPTAVMCAEADPQRCHRRLLSDALLLAGLTVVHILQADHKERHVLDPALRAEGGRITYPAGPARQGRLFERS
jgi:uncharacterized protein (DUF488 family)